MRANKAKVELTAIYLVAALLILSLIGLGENVVRAAQPEPYPELYTPAPGEFTVPKRKTVYFTFDDGPSVNTEKVLDVLKEQEIPATFFVSAQNADAEYAPRMLRRIVDEGHTLGLHSYSHRYDRIYPSTDGFLQDISVLNDYIWETAGVRPEIFRFPGGSATVNASPQVMKSIIAEMGRRGYLYYDWHVSGGDDTATAYAPEYLAERMVRQALEFDYPVILLHDNPGATTTAEAVTIAADALRREGYRFDCLTPQVEPVHIQTSRFRLDE